MASVQGIGVSSDAAVVIGRVWRSIRWRLAQVRPPRDAMEPALRAFAALSQPPRTVFDVGAAQGTPSLYRAFPDSTFVLVEPLEEFQGALAKVAERLSSAHVVLCAAGSREGSAALNVHPDLVGSSFHLEPEDDESVNGVPRSVPVTTLDSLTEELRLQPPFFIKIDTQGHESEVLRGATSILDETGAVLLELSLFDFFEGAPSFAAVVNQMAQRGFVMYDVFDRRYRLLDGALGQFDALFVPERSDLRRSHRYANDVQRKEQTARIQKSLSGVNASPRRDDA